MNTHDIKRYAVSGDIAYPINEDPEGDYVTYEDHVAAIEADRKRWGEPVAYVPLVLGSGKPEWSGTLPIGHEFYEMYKDKCPWKPLYAAPQPAEHNIDYKQLYEQMCDRCDSLDAKLAEYEHRGEPVAYLDLGMGGYMDVGTDLTDEQLAALPKGRHMLAIVGTYGVDGYTEADSQPAEPAFTTPDCRDCGCVQDGQCLCNPSKPPADHSGASTLHNADSGAQIGIQAPQPSDEEIRSLAKNHMLAHAQFVGAGEVWYEGEVKFARDLLARYTTTKEQP